MDKLCVDPGGTPPSPYFWWSDLNNYFLSLKDMSKNLWMFVSFSIFVSFGVKAQIAIYVSTLQKIEVYKMNLKEFSLYGGN